MSAHQRAQGASSEEPIRLADPPSSLRDAEAEKRSMGRCPLTGQGAAVSGPLDQGLQQELELADLNLAIEGIIGAIDDRDGQRAVVAVALEQGDDAGVFDLALADAD